jgi:hypothetical protein
MRSTRGFVGALVIISAATLVACSGSPKGTATSATPAPTSTTLVSLPALGVELPASQIPWGRVGPGWILATWSPAPGASPGQAPPAGQPVVAPVTLYLLDPVGGRYAITTLPVLPALAPGDLGHPPRLVDWSGDGRHALFEDYVTAPNGPGYTTMTEVDLAAGAKQTFTVGTLGVEGAYSRPTGQTILLSRFVDYEHGSRLERVDLGGTQQLTFPTDLGAAGKFNGAYLESPDGGHLVLGAANGLVMVGNDGVVARQLPAPGPLTDCSPVRWWTSTVILARCDHGKQDPGKYPDLSSQLWQVPLAGGAPAALTAVNTDQEDSGFGGDLGDDDAWQLPGGTFLQSEGGCSTGFLSRLTPDKHTAPVSVPGVDEDRSVFVTGASADKLVLRATMACGSGVSVLTYDPVANTSTVLLGPPVNGGGVQNAILYPGP